MTRGGSSPRPRHIPQRTCVVCRQGQAKRELVRIVRTPSGAVEIDPSGKKSGRGAYLCHEPACWDAALRKNVLPRALKIETLPSESLAYLTAYATQVRADSTKMADLPSIAVHPDAHSLTA